MLPNTGTNSVNSFLPLSESNANTNVYCPPTSCFKALELTARTVPNHYLIDTRYPYIYCSFTVSKRTFKWDMKIQSRCDKLSED